MILQGTKRKLTYVATYEVLAFLFGTLGFFSLSDSSIERAGALAFFGSLFAVSWNFTYNALFEKWESKRITRGRSFARRVVHAIGFEVGFLLVLMPAAAWRHWNIIEERLSKHPYMLGEAYGIVDMALWPWARMIPRILNEDAFKSLPNVKRLLDEVSERPSAKRALELQSKHEFKTTLDDEARKAMFPSNERLKKAGA